MRSTMAAAAATTLLLCGCASMGAEAPPVAPQPTHAVTNPGRFYSGAWREIARNPMKITQGCVAGVTRFQQTGDGGLYDRDSCRMGDPVSGKEKVFAGPAIILDPPASTKFRTDYKVFGLFHVSRTYWVLDNGEDEGGWFIVATPDFKNLSIFTRTPQPSAALKARLVSRAQVLGYDTGKLEFPAQPPA
ncbi:MAG: lipocalin family protein [Caulobacteraceae bacterium]|nr:lipocalin family protein [Caulobacter sp.]